MKKMKVHRVYGWMMLCLAIAALNQCSTDANNKTISASERSELALLGQELLKKLPNDTAARKELPSALFIEFNTVKKNFTELANSKHLSDQEFLAIVAKIDAQGEKIDKILFGIPTAEGCLGDVNSERKACQSDCKGQGKKFCGCIALAIADGICCIVCGAGIPGTGG